MSSTAASAVAEVARTTGPAADATGSATLRIIAGPTGAGKSALAMRLAERHGAVIISADSRQIYRGFDIGTAKPTAAERARVPHDGIDVAEPNERWSAARWADAASGWVHDLQTAERPTIIVGGTGLWLRALVQPLADEPPMDAERRLALQAAMADMETPTLRRWVQALDPARAGPRMGRTQFLRAIEVALLSGVRLSARMAAGTHKPRRRARWLIVDPGAALHARLETRIDAMFAAGWVDEVRRLMRYVPADAPAWNACGYREIREVVEGRSTEAEAREKVLISTRQYAKRQRTWFRNQLEESDPDTSVTRIDPLADRTRAEDSAERWFHGLPEGSPGVGEHA